MTLRFPEGFLLGTATSSHQVEGHQTNNDWVAAEQAGGTVFEGQQSGVACDWWHRAEEDFDRMAAMGQTAHRLSLEWSRIQPAPDRWEGDAIERYRQMLLALRERGIEPMVTLHHFTNPLWMAERGGWTNPESPQLFDVYVRKVVDELGDLATLWCTINEPMVLIGQGYLLGIWPPGEQDFWAAKTAGINLTKAHAAAYHTLHEELPGAKVGLAKHIVAWEPDRFWLPHDHIASRLTNRLTNLVILDAVTSGTARLPLQRPIHIPEAANTLDWLGVNYYQRYRVGLYLRRLLRRFAPGDIFFQGTAPDLWQGPGGWGEIHAEGLRETLHNVSRYEVPVYITENGIPDETDKYRPRFILEHLYAVHQAIEEGIPVEGYFHWSMVDNFEWAEGYNPAFRFGLYGVDRETQERTPKTSAALYEEICKAHGLLPGMAERYAPDLLEDLQQPKPA